MRPGAATATGALLIALAMSGTLSFAMVWINTGVGSGFLSRWLPAWGGGVLVGIPQAVVLPLAKRLASRLTPDPNPSSARK